MKRKKIISQNRIAIVFLTNFYCFSMLFLLFPNQCITQPLSQFIDQSLRENLTLQTLTLEYRTALEKAPQLSQLPDPDVGIGAFVSPVETRLGAQRARISASQMFPWFGTLEAREEVALAQAQALYERIAGAELDLAYQVKAAYLQLYEIQTAQEILRQNIRILEALRQLSLTKVESGKGMAADVLGVELKVQELRQELAILNRQQEKPLADLNQILNRPMQTPVLILDSLSFASMPFNKDTLSNHIRNNHPTIRMFALQQEASRKSLALNELEGKPSFGIGMDYILVDGRSDANPLNNGRDILQLSAKVSIPLWRKKYEAKEREENLKIETFEHRKLDLESRFLAAIEKAYTDYETARLRMELYTQQISTTKAAIEILRTNYSATGNRFDELLRLEKDLVDYDLKILKAVVQSHMAKINIERFLIL